MSSQNNRIQNLENQIEDLRKALGRQHEKIVKLEKFSASGEKASKPLLDSIANSVIALFTALLFVASMLQWFATRDAIEDTHKSFQIGTRAWVTVKKADVQPAKADAPDHEIIQEGEGIKGSKAPVVSVTLTNTGHSPALEVKTQVEITVKDKLMGDEYVLPTISENQFDSVSVLAPDSQSVFGRAYLFGGNDLDEVTKGRKFLTIYGVSRYRDIFGFQHETKFCSFYDSSIEKMTSCPQFNSAN
jgi:hypothetical protein